MLRNTESVFNERLKLGVQIDSAKPDVVAVTETYMIKSVDNGELGF